MCSRGWSYIVKAGTIILVCNAAVTIMQEYSWNLQPAQSADASILASIGGPVSVLLIPLGFGTWQMASAAITGFIAKENVVSTLGTLATCLVGAVIDIEADGGVGAVTTMIVSTGVTLPALLSFIAFNMTTIPCFAAVAAAKGEMIKKSTFNWTLVFWLLTSYIVASAIYLIGSYWWTAFIYLALAIMAFVIVKIYNKIQNYL